MPLVQVNNLVDISSANVTATALFDILAASCDMSWIATNIFHSSSFTGSTQTPISPAFHFPPLHIACRLLVSTIEPLVDLSLKEYPLKDRNDTMTISRLNDNNEWWIYSFLLKKNSATDTVSCCSKEALQIASSQCGCFQKQGYPQNTPKWSFLVGKPMVVGYHHFRKPPCHCLRTLILNANLSQFPLQCSHLQSIWNFAFLATKCRIQNGFGLLF